MNLLAWLLAAGPFAFALIRAARTSDVRYVWVAIAASCGAAAVLAFARGTNRRMTFAFVMSGLVFLAATVGAMLAALVLGTALGPGLLVVAAGFGACFSAGCFVHLLTRA